MLDHFFLYQYCPLCPYESKKINISPNKTLKETFQFGNFWDWNVNCSVNCLIWSKDTSIDITLKRGPQSCKVELMCKIFGLFWDSFHNFLNQDNSLTLCVIHFCKSVNVRSDFMWTCRIFGIFSKFGGQLVFRIHEALKLAPGFPRAVTGLGGRWQVWVAGSHWVPGGRSREGGRRMGRRQEQGLLFIYIIIIFSFIDMM